MTTHVFIPTRSRAHLIERTKDKWLSQKDTEVILVLEPRRTEVNSYRDLPFKIVTLREPNMGMGRIRQEILDLADSWNLESFVMADDDSYPQAGQVKKLADVVLERGVIGCGASSSYHGLMIGNEVLNMKPSSFPIAGGYGHILFGINVDAAFRAGGYPEWATAWGEDTELQRCGIKMGMPWYYTTHVRMASVARRYSPGGLSSQYKGTRRKRQEVICHRMIYERWPDYVSHPKSGRFRCYWKKMMEDFCPRWQEQVPPRVRKVMKIA